MSGPSAFEQQLLEYTNRARANPAGEYNHLIASASTQTARDSDVTNALRYFDVDLDLFRSLTANLPSVAPVNWNAQLALGADRHSQAMIDRDTQSHQLSGELGLRARLEAVGYDQRLSLRENVYAYAESALYAHAGFFIDWGFGKGGMQDPAGHRVTMLSDRVTEVGLGVIEEDRTNTKVGPFVVTQDFGNRVGSQDYLLGVVIDDRDGDRFYDMGEGMAGVTITAKGAGGTVTTTSWTAGGYQMVLKPGTWDVTFAGGGLDGTIKRSVVIGTENVKVDAVAGDAKPVRQSSSEGDSAGNDLVGTSGNNTLRGHGGNDVLDGRAGNDVLHGGSGHDRLIGGSGNDRMIGDGGNDRYGVDSARDVVVEARKGGTDRVDASVSHALAANVETLYLQGSAAINGTGNDLANTLVGNGGNNGLKGGGGDDVLVGGSGNDSLDGGSGQDSLDGGSGNDRLIGGSGNDVYHVSSRSDVVIEAASGGTDQVRTSVTCTLGAHVENMLLTGSAAIKGYGNAVANRLLGNDGNNVLNGGGGNDVLKAGRGNDTLDGSSGNDALDGGSGNDTLIGGRGNDVLDGSTGKDQLTGGAGNDAFRFIARRGAADSITDFRNVSGNNDYFQIDASAFGGGLREDRTLAASQFQVRGDNVAQDGNDRFIFRTTDRSLWFDSNGSASGGLTMIADLDSGARVTSADIFLI